MARPKQLFGIRRKNNISPAHMKVEADEKYQLDW